MGRLEKVEVLLVAGVLTTVAVMSGGRITDWCAAGAVLAGFIHSSLSFLIAEKIERGPAADHHTAQLVRFTYLLKEAIWIVTFLLLGSYPLLAGAVLFITYPCWHRGLTRIETQLSAVRESPLSEQPA